MSKKSIAQLKLLTNQIIKSNGNQEITAPLDNSLRTHVLDSFLNLKDGGLTIESEVGYLSAITPSSDYAFATKRYVDDATSSIDLSDYLKKDGTTVTTGNLQIGAGLGFTWADGSFIRNTAGQGVELLSNDGKYNFYNAAGTRVGQFNFESLSGSRIFTFPNTAGTIALTSDIPSLTPYIKRDGTSAATFGNIQMGNGVGLEWLASATIQATSGQLVLTGGTGYFNISSSSLYFYTGSTFGSLLDTNNLTADRYNQMPDRDGILATLDDIPSLTGYLSNTLASAKIFVGSVGNVATAQTLSLSGSAGSFALSNAGVLTMPDAATGTRGLLNATDWNTFNNKQATISGTTNRITVSSNIVDISASYVGQASITTVGALTSGSIGSGFTAIPYARLSLTGSIVNADITNATIDLTTKVTGILPGTNGGTGVNNSTRTMTYAGNVTFTGAFNATFAVPLTATWTLPTPASGTASTLVGLETVQTFTQVNTFSTTTGTEINVLKIRENNGGAGSYLTALNSTSAGVLLIGSAFTTITLAGAATTNGNLTVGTNMSSDFVRNKTTGTKLSILTQNRASAIGDDIVIKSGNITAGAFQSGHVYITSGTSAAGTVGNFGLFTETGSFGGGERLMFINNATTAAGTDPTGGILLWSEGAKFRIREGGMGSNNYIVNSAGAGKVTAGAPYTNDGYVTVVINGTTYKLMTTA